MKKKIVLLSLLVLPLVLYIYFSMAKHNSLFLPVITTNVSELPNATAADTTKPFLANKITVLGFIGNDIVKKKEVVFNINQKIHNKYKGFTDFQLVMVAPDGTQADVQRVQAEMKMMADTSGWKFVFLSPEEIQALYSSLKVKGRLDADMGTFNLYIIDKDLSLRGRKGKDKDGEEEYRDGYNSFSAAELHNEMTDDIKIVLREYRLALKKNNVKRQI